MFDLSNSLFQLAVRFVNETAASLFLTGKAGTGKTTFLKYIRDTTEKKMAVVAPTGVAAINAGGVTMHSFFQLPFGSYVPGDHNGWVDAQLAVTDRHSLLKNLKINTEKRTLLQEIELLIIDEVSMVRADTLDSVDVILRHYRKQPFVPFGGVQVIFIGDLFQLPPVVNREEWEILRRYYKSPFFFDSHVVQHQPPIYLELKKIYRQKDSAFIDILNNIRSNKVRPEDLAVLHEKYQPGFTAPRDEEYIVLTSHNAKAEAINKRALNELPGKPVSFTATVEGDFNDKALPAEMNLTVKEGAQVMFIKNDKGENRKFFNGKIGTVSRITEKNIFVKFTDQADELEIGTETWKNIRYRFDKVKNRIEEEEVGSFNQFPIRLAWAITIHKSQGLTFEKAIIDAGESFAPGQVYVALSRLISLEGLIIYSKIVPGCIRTDDRIIEYSNTEKQEEVILHLLESEKKIYINKKLLQLFDWSKLILSVEQFIEEYPSRVIPEKASAHIWADELLTDLKNQHEIALKFIRQLENIRRQPGPDADQLINQRIEAGVKYFVDGLNAASEKIEKHIEIYKIKQKTRKYVSDVYDLADSLMRKKAEIRRAVAMAGLEKEMYPIGEMTVPEETRQYISGSKDRTKVKTHSKQITFELFELGNSVEQIAALRSMAISTIQGHLISFLDSGKVTIDQLVEKNKQEHISKCIKLNPDAGYSVIKEKLGEEYSYGEIKAVAEYEQWMKKNQSAEVQA